MKQTTKRDIAVIFLHPGCNMSCRFCITEDNFSHMTFDQAILLLNHLKKKQFINVIFGGGEPLTWEHDLLGLTKVAKDMGFFVQLGTNGILLKDGFESIPTIDRYILPLDSLDQDKHNYLRSHNQSHHVIILSLIDRLQKSQKSLTVSTVVTKQNLNEIHEIGKFLDKKNTPNAFIHAWHLYKFVPEGKGGSINQLELEIADSEFQKVVDQAKELLLSFDLFKRSNMYLSKRVDFFWVKDNQICRASANR